MKSRLVTRHNIDQAKRIALIGDAVAGSEYRLIFTEIGNRPAHADCGREVVVVVAVELFAGRRRLFAYQLHLRQRSAGMAGLIQITPRRSGNSEDRWRSSN